MLRVQRLAPCEWRFERRREARAQLKGLCERPEGVLEPRAAVQGREEGLDPLLPRCSELQKGSKAPRLLGEGAAAVPGVQASGRGA